MAVDAAVLNAPQHHFTSTESAEVLVIDLPMLQSLAGVELDICSSEVRLGLPGGSRSSISVPKGISARTAGAEAAAKFSKKKNQLTISWPVDASAEQQATDTKVDAKEMVVPADEAAPARTVEARASSCVEAPAQRSGASRDAATDTASPIPQAAKDVAPQKAYGSIWNANSWHWETKNCMDLVRAEVTQALHRCTEEKLKYINELAGATFIFSAIQIDGEASFTLRKGKRFLCYEVSLTFNWEARDEYGGPLGAKGKGEVPELTQDEDTPPVSMEVFTTFSGGKDGKAAGEWMKREGKKTISASIGGTGIIAAVMASEEARVNADEDAARRAEEKAKAEAAMAATAQQREATYAEQKQQEEARRIQAATGGVQGSVWNAGSWHWEEKPMTSWAHSWLQRKMQDVSVSILGGLAKTSLSDIKVSGDASVSVRKGRPIALFSIRLECKWVVKPVDAGIGEAQGTILIPDFTSEDGAKSSLEVHASERVRKSSMQLVTAVRRDVVPPVRAIMGEFVTELTGQFNKSA